MSSSTVVTQSPRSPARAVAALAGSSYHQRVPAQLDTGGDAFGDRLRSLRERAGPIQQELGNRVGLMSNAVSALKRLRGWASSE